ncbi:Serine/threonine-protein phosphatase Pgam5 mitochondrial [Bienertia sinuspersici]
MRQNETYYGKRKWDCGLKASNLDAMKKLRIQYSNEILTNEVKKNKEELDD